MDGLSPADRRAMAVPARARTSRTQALLVLGELYNRPQAGFTAVNRAAVRGNRDGFHVGAVRPLALPSGVWPDFRHEAGHLAVFGAADVDAILEPRAIFGGLGVGDIQRVVLVDGKPARAAKLLP